MISRKFSVLLIRTTVIGLLTYQISLAIDSSSPSGKSCSDLLSLPAEEFEKVRSDFPHNNSYTFEVESTPIKDQCNGGNCWIYARTSDLERQIYKQTGKIISLSESYLTVKALQERSLDALDHAGQNVGSSGSVLATDWLIQQHGVVPTSVWKPRIDFEKSSHLSRLLYFLNSRISQFHVEASQKEVSPDQRGHLLVLAKKDVLNLIQAFSGALPESFEYEGKTYSPQSWAESFLPRTDERLHMLEVLWEPLPQILSELGKDRIKLSLNNDRMSSRAKPSVPESGLAQSDYRPIEQLEQIIINSMQKGENVLIGFGLNFHFIDHATGIMSLGAFPLPEGFVSSTQHYREAVGLASDGHLVDVVGVDIDLQTNRIVKLKIKNSWGDGQHLPTGDGGYYHMYRDYFVQFLHAVYVRKPF